MYVWVTGWVITSRFFLLIDISETAILACDIWSWNCQLGLKGVGIWIQKIFAWYMYLTITHYLYIIFYVIVSWPTLFTYV